MKNDVYENLSQLIEELRVMKKDTLAETLSHRVNKVSWTTSSELFYEIRNILDQELETNKNELSVSTRNRINELLSSIPE